MGRKYQRQRNLRRTTFHQSKKYFFINIFQKRVKTINKDQRKVIYDDGSESNFIETLPIINGEKIDVDDMVATKDINEVDLLYNLKNRLSQEKTFTNVGPT